MLDTDYITATLADGRKFEAKLVGADPRLEIAVLKIEAAGLDHFDLAHGAAADAGTRVLAFSNLFGVATGDEPDSVQHGVMAAKTRLDARRGAYETPYHGPVYVLDAMTNNPGAAGGALTNLQRRTAGHARQRAAQLAKQHLAQLCGSGRSVHGFGRSRSSPARLWPRLPKTEGDSPGRRLESGSAGRGDGARRAGAHAAPISTRCGPTRRRPPAGLQADDLIVFVGEHLVQSLKALADGTGAARRRMPRCRLVVLRGQELIDVLLKADAAAEPQPPARSASRRDFEEQADEE